MKNSKKNSISIHKGNKTLEKCLLDKNANGGP